MALIEVENLTKRYRRRTALDGIGFTVDEGEVVCLAGPNGAGKSTTVGVLMGFLQAQGGTARVLGEDPLSRRHLGKVGWMPEQPAFPAHLRVDRLIRFQAGSFPTWDHELAESLRQRLEIDPAPKAGRLSRGQRARLALLFALAHRPRLLLLDDPTLGLDPAARRLLLGELLGAAAEGGAGVLLTTHLLAEVDPALAGLFGAGDGGTVAVFLSRLALVMVPFLAFWAPWSGWSRERREGSLAWLYARPLSGPALFSLRVAAMLVVLFFWAAAALLLLFTAPAADFGGGGLGVPLFMLTLSLFGVGLAFSALDSVNAGLFGLFALTFVQISPALRPLVGSSGVTPAFLRFDVASAVLFTAAGLLAAWGAARRAPLDSARYRHAALYAALPLAAMAVKLAAGW